LAQPLVDHAARGDGFGCSEWALVLLFNILQNLTKKWGVYSDAWMCEGGGGWGGGGYTRYANLVGELGAQLWPGGSLKT